MTDTASYVLSADSSPLSKALTFAQTTFANFGKRAGAATQVISKVAKDVWSSITKNSDECWRAVTEVCQGSVALMNMSLGDLDKVATATFNAIGAAASAAWAAVSGGASIAIGVIGKVFATALNIMAAPFKALYSVVSGVFTFAKTTIMGVFSTISMSVTGAVSFVTSKIKQLASGAYAILKGLVPMLNAGLFDGLTHGIQEFIATEAGLFKVANAVKATGMVAGFDTKQLAAMADQMQELTVFGDDAALAAQAAVLQFKNIRGDIFTGAIKMAADLASATGIDLVGASDKLARALDDPIGGIRVLRSEGIKFSEAEQEMIDMMVKGGQIVKAQQFMLERLAGTFGGAAAAEAKTFGGQIKMLNNYISDLWKAVAAKLTPAITAVLPIIKYMSEASTKAAGTFASWTTAVVLWAKDSWPVIQEWSKKVLAVIADTVTKVADWIVTRISEAFSFVQTVVTEFPVFWEAAKTKILYYWEAMKIGIMDIWDVVSNKVRTTWVDTLNAMRTMFIDFVASVAGISLGISNSLAGSIITAQEKAGVITKQQAEERRKELKEMRQAEIDMAKQSVKEKLSRAISPLQAAKKQVSVTDEQREKLKELGIDAENAGDLFGMRFQMNMAKNKKSMDAMKAGLLSILGLGKEAEAEEATDAFGVKGRKSNEEFTIEKEDKNGAQFEDLVSLQKRISGAAAKSPELTATQQQTNILKQHHAKVEKKLDDLKKPMEEVAKNTDKVFGPDHVGPKFID